MKSLEFAFEINWPLVVISKYLGTLFAPTLEYCPRDNSRKKAGKPTKTNMTM